MSYKREISENLKNIKLTIEYDGTAYSGWQRQNNVLAVEEVITKALQTLTGEDIKIFGASRTDAGVHAFGQVANFFTNSKIPPDKFCYAINEILPEDIVIKDSSQVSVDFHSRFSVRGKKYLYTLYNSRFPSAMYRNKAYHVRGKLDFSAMQLAAEHFVGTHDFEAFRASGCAAKSSIKTISDIKLVQNGDFINIEISGKSFLYNMVRIIAGTILYAGTGKICHSDIPKIILSKDRKLAGKTLSSCGLFLFEIYY